MRLRGLTPHRIINESEISPVPVAETVSVLGRHASEMTIVSLARNTDAAAVVSLAAAL